MAERVFLGLGANLGDREANLARARELLGQRCGTVAAVSSLYETEPVDYLDQPAFLNQVLELASAPPPADLLRQCLAIEAELGRARSLPKGPRLIDIDLLLYGQQVIELTEPLPLVVPHPRLHLRRFVLEPLAELAAGLTHPTLNRSIGDLLDQLADPAWVRRTK